MKILKNKLFRIISGIIAVLFGVLSFSACYGVQPCAYGSPNATYKLDGTIKSSVNNNGINNLKISLTDLSSDYSLIDVTSDSVGNYSLTTNTFPNDKFILKIKDVDGQENGNYESKDLTIDFSDINYTDPGKSWYHGKKEKIIDIEVDPKE